MRRADSHRRHRGQSPAFWLLNYAAICPPPVTLRVLLDVGQARCSYARRVDDDRGGPGGILARNQPGKSRLLWNFELRGREQDGGGPGIRTPGPAGAGRAGSGRRPRLIRTLSDMGCGTRGSIRTITSRINSAVDYCYPTRVWKLVPPAGISPARIRLEDGGPVFRRRGHRMGRAPRYRPGCLLVPGQAGPLSPSCPKIASLKWCPRQDFRLRPPAS